jgi:hypothetical protein
MPNLAAVLGDLSASLTFANAIIASAHVTDAAGAFVQPLDIRSFLTEAAVVRTHIAWERFLEQSFLSYLMGETSIAGAQVVTYLAPPNLDHANRVLIGTQRYVDWGHPEIVVKLAELYFRAGAPYKTTLAAIQTDLFDLRSVRNAAAHLSTNTSTQLDGVGLRRLKKAAVGITVYDLVTASDPSTSGQTVLQSFMDILVAAATVIAT